MKKLSVLVMAAGMGSRFGGLKQMVPMDDQGNALLDYSVRNALSVGFEKIVFVIRKDFFEEFRSNVGKKYETFAEVEYVFQELSDLPGRFQCPDDRTKPWGTGHAVFSARNSINGPFAVVNADDYYGKDGFAALVELFCQPPSNAGIPEYALVAYDLASTLSQTGAVSRGICAFDDSGFLSKIEEHSAVSPLPNGNVGSFSKEGAFLAEFPPSTPVSVNFWGFDERFFPMLEDKFIQFLNESIFSPTKEFFLPTAVWNLMDEKKIRVRMPHSKTPWFGITYREDLEGVKKALALLNETP